MKQVIILFGPPGAGKGTQAGLLADKFGMHHFETSKILEKEFKKAGSERFVEFEGKKIDILNEKKLWTEGILCSPPFVTYLVMKEIKALSEEGKSIVFSSSPRTLYEVERELPLLEELYGKENIKTFLIEISPEDTIFRNSHRKICELMRHSILYDKQTENLTICPIDGSKLLKREGLDDPETIKVRLKEYAERTLPMFEYFKKHGFAINKIKGQQEIVGVHRDILKDIK